MHDIVMMLALFAGVAALALLDKKYQLGLMTGIGSDSHCETRGDKRAPSASDRGKEAQIRQLEQRIEVLERIVTDPQEQLKRDINAL